MESPAGALIETTGASFAAWIRTLAVDTPPLPSPTVRTAVNVPLVVYEWVGLTAVECAVPSPKSQSYVSGSLFGSVDDFSRIDFTDTGVTRFASLTQLSAKFNVTDDVDMKHGDPTGACRAADKKKAEAAQGESESQGQGEGQQGSLGQVQLRQIEGPAGRRVPLLVPRRLLSWQLMSGRTRR